MHVANVRRKLEATIAEGEAVAEVEYDNVANGGGQEAASHDAKSPSRLGCQHENGQDDPPCHEGQQHSRRREPKSIGKQVPDAVAESVELRRHCVVAQLLIEEDVDESTTD